jgi:ethanolamine utilization protein EutQ (cupin superfamily)
MKEKETKAKDSIEYILEGLLEIISQDKRVDHADGDDTSFVRAPKEIYASPEEGAHLIRAFGSRSEDFSFSSPRSPYR